MEALLAGEERTPPSPYPCSQPREAPGRVGGFAVFNLSSHRRRLRDVRLSLRTVETVRKSKKFEALPGVQVSTLGKSREVSHRREWRPN